MISNELLLESPVEQLEAIARRFKELRLATNVRQADLAKRSGVGIATIRRFEAGGNISVLNLARLMTYLGHPMDAASVVPEFQATTMKEFVQPSRRRREGRGHLVLQRFDRTREGALHLHSFRGLAHASAGCRMHDYEFLHRAVLRLTGDASEPAECFGRMAFNVLTCNQDDHSKQHAFLFDGTAWKLAPAFDLTFSPNPALGHAMTVSGNPSPSHKDLLTFARKMDVQNGRDILERIQTVISSAKNYLDKNQVPEGVAKRVLEGIPGRGMNFKGRAERPFQAGQIPAHHLPRLMRRGVPSPHFSRAAPTSSAWRTRTPEKMKCPPGLSFFTRPGAEAMRSSL